jgi:hypothetical protein
MPPTFAGDITESGERGGWLSDEVWVAVAPASTYRRLLTDDARLRWRMVKRPAMVLLAIGITVPIMAIQRVTIGLVASALVAWSFVLAMQMSVGVCVIATGPARRVGMARSLDLWFAGSLPYSLWLLGVAVWASTGGASLDVIVVSALGPAVWTAVIAAAFCRTVLGATVWGARWRAAAHQAATWAIALSLIAWSAGGWFQVVAAVAERARAVE